MNTLTRKAREIAAREDLILQAAHALLEQHGYLGLNMDRIAAAAEYSKGTIYQHFANKEAVLAAFCLQGGERRTELFRRAAAFEGRARERMTAVGVSLELWVRLYPLHFKTEQVFNTESIREKIPAEQVERLSMCELTCMQIVAGIVADAVAEGDLELPAEVAPTDVCFGLWSITYGGHGLIAAKPHLSDVGVADPAETLRRNQHAIMDGFGWGPLSADWDYQATRERILATCFAAEAKQAGLA